MSPVPITYLAPAVFVAFACLAASCAPVTASTSPARAKAATPAATPAPAPPIPSAGSAGTRPPAPAPLVGHVTRAAVEGYETWRTLRAEDYTPDAEAVRAIGSTARHVDVLLVLATWCPDSKREVPRFFKILDEASIGLDRVTLVAVDRTKKDAEGLTERHNVTRVPTFIFFRDGREIGRVTERAATTLEGDIAAILAR